MPLVINTPAQTITAGQIKRICTNTRDFSYGRMHEALTKLSKDGKINREGLQKVLHEMNRVRNLAEAKYMEIIELVANKQG